MKVPRTLAIADVEPGMQLAAPLLDESGRVLVPADGELDQGILQRLARRGIAELTVLLAVKEDGAASEAHRQRVQSELDRLFRRAGEGAETRQLFQSILDFRMEQGQ